MMKNDPQTRVGNGCVSGDGLLGAAGMTALRGLQGLDLFAQAARKAVTRWIRHGNGCFEMEKPSGYGWFMIVSSGKYHEMDDDFTMIQFWMIWGYPRVRKPPFIPFFGIFLVLYIIYRFIPDISEGFLDQV